MEYGKIARNKLELQLREPRIEEEETVRMVVRETGVCQVKEGGMEERVLLHARQYIDTQYGETRSGEGHGDGCGRVGQSDCE